VPRAIFAWHLFPDLLVLRGQTKPVRFNDRLFTSTALATIGLEKVRGLPDGGTGWSLALSHLQYYGPPVEVESQYEIPRVTIGQLRLVALGVLFAKWEIHHSEYLLTARWLTDLWSLLFDDEESSPEWDASQRLNWLYPLIRVSKYLLLTELKSSDALIDARRLVLYRHRRGAAFLGGYGARVEPYFGLCNMRVLAGVGIPNDMECSLRFLRWAAAHSDLQAQDGFIMLAHSTQGYTRGHQPEFFEFATLVPSKEIPGSEGEKVRSRWLHEYALIRRTDERTRPLVGSKTTNSEQRENQMQ
jgi:hypothetical protein